MAQPKSPESTSPAARSLASALAAGGTDHRASLSGLHVFTHLPPQPNEPERRAFHAADADGVARYWSPSVEAGLAAGEAERRLARLGPNKLDEQAGATLLRRLLNQVSDFTVLALLGAAAIAAGLSIYFTGRPSLSAASGTRMSSG
jgi:magnesium-transporting ATPase (P-type)